VGDAQNLMSAAGALAQHLANLARRLARHAGVDLIVNDGGDGVPVGQGVLDGQGDAAQFAARSDLGQRFRRLAGVGGDVKFNAVLPVAGQRPAAVPQAEAHPRHIQKVQRVRDAAVQLLKGFQAGLGQGLGGLPGQAVQPVLFGLKPIVVLLRKLDALQFLAGLFPKSQHVLHCRRISV